MTMMNGFDAIYRATQLHMRELQAQAEKDRLVRQVYRTQARRPKHPWRLRSDVFMKALAHFDLTRAEHSTVAWLYREARNAVTDYWRQGQGWHVVARDGAQMPGTQPLAAAGAPLTRRRGCGRCWTACRRTTARCCPIASWRGPV